MTDYSYVDILWILFIFPGFSVATFFILFLVHIFFSERSSFLSKNNIWEYCYFSLLRPVGSLAFALILYSVLEKMYLPRIDSSNSSAFLDQLFLGISLYIFFELVATIFHFTSHHISTLSFLHKEHHSIQELHWTNAGKESWIFELCLTALLTLCTYLLSVPLHIAAFVIVIWKVILAVTHFSVPFSYGYLDLLLVSPHFHLKHHRERGAYGITLSVFDILFLLIKQKYTKS